MRKSLAAAVIAVAVVAPMAPSAFAAPGPHANSHSRCATSTDISAKAYKNAAKKAKKAKKVKSTFVNGGRVTGVTATTLTFHVKGGPDKCLRDTDLTVTVTPTTKITRGHVVVPALGAVLVGDHVNVKGTKSAVINVGTLYTATRIAAEAPTPVVTPVP
jgi:hypothetical protein